MITTLKIHALLHKYDLQLLCVMLLFCSAVCITLGGRSIDNMQIFVHSHDFCLPHAYLTPLLRVCHQNIAITYGMEKLEWCHYPAVRGFEYMFICFDRIHGT